MLTPMDMLFQEVNMKEIEYDIDNSMKSFHGWRSFEQAIIDGEYPVEVRNIISTMYVKAGWNYVYHKTSSENGERPGLTQFYFSVKKLDDEITKGFHMVSNEVKYGL